MRSTLPRRSWRRLRASFPFCVRALHRSTILYAAYRIYTDLAGEAILGLSVAAPESGQMHQAMAHELYVSEILRPRLRISIRPLQRTLTCQAFTSNLPRPYTPRPISPSEPKPSPSTSSPSQTTPTTKKPTRSSVISTPTKETRRSYHGLHAGLATPARGRRRSLWTCSRRYEEE